MFKCGNVLGNRRKPKDKRAGRHFGSGVSYVRTKDDYAVSGTNETTVFNMNANVLVHFEPAKKTPMFCVFAVYDDDCVVNESGDSLPFWLSLRYLP